MKSKKKSRPRGSLTDAIIQYLEPFSAISADPPYAFQIADHMGVETREITGVLTRLAKTGRIGRADRYGNLVYFKAQTKAKAAASAPAEPSAPAFV